MKRIYRDNFIDVRSLMAGLLLLIISLYYVNISLFSHYHVVDGVTIVHSHFYSEGHTDSDSQEHSESELTLIQIISNFVVESQSVVVFAFFVALSGVLLYGVYLNVQFFFDVAAHPQLRAPPAEPILG